MRDERRDVTMTCGRVLSTNHSEIMSAFKWLAARQAVTAGLESNVQPRQLLCFIIFSRFLALNSQLARVTNKHPLPASNYKAHVFFYKEPLLRVVIRNSHGLVKLPNPYTYYLKYIL